MRGRCLAGGEGSRRGGWHIHDRYNVATVLAEVPAASKAVIRWRAAPSPSPRPGRCDAGTCLWRRGRRLRRCRPVCRAHALCELAIARLGLTGDEVLELGCGSGVYFAALRAAVGDTGRVVGVDHGAALLRLARQRIDRHGWVSAVLVHVEIGERLDGVPFDAALVFGPMPHWRVRRPCWHRCTRRWFPVAC